MKDTTDGLFKNFPRIVIDMDIVQTNVKASIY